MEFSEGAKPSGSGCLPKSRGSSASGERISGEAVHRDNDSVFHAADEETPMLDTIATLRALCIHEDHTLPCSEVVQQSDSAEAEAPEFGNKCEGASAVPFATGATKKTNKRLAPGKCNNVSQKVGLFYQRKEIEQS